MSKDMPGIHSKRNMPGIYEVLKYVVLVAAVVYIAVLMLYTSGSNKPFEEVQTALEETLKDTDMKEMDAQMLKRNFGLNSADYAGVMYYSSESSISAEEVLLIKVKREDQAGDVTDAITERIEDRLNDFEGKLPEEERLLKEAQQSVRGKYIFFAVSEKASEYRNVFDRSL